MQQNDNDDFDTFDGFYNEDYGLDLDEDDSEEIVMEKKAVSFKLAREQFVSSFISNSYVSRSLIFRQNGDSPIVDTYKTVCHSFLRRGLQDGSRLVDYPGLPMVGRPYYDNAIKAFDSQPVSEESVRKFFASRSFEACAYRSWVSFLLNDPLFSQAYKEHDTFSVFLRGVEVNTETDQAVVMPAIVAMRIGGEYPEIPIVWYDLVRNYGANPRAAFLVASAVTNCDVYDLNFWSHNHIHLDLAKISVEKAREFVRGKKDGKMYTKSNPIKAGYRFFCEKWECLESPSLSTALKEVKLPYSTVTRISMWGDKETKTVRGTKDPRGLSPFLAKFIEENF